MKIIIGVWHTQSAGRKSTLREFARILIEKHPFAEIICLEHDGQTIETIPATDDFRLVLKIKGKTIGIECKNNSYNKPYEQLKKLVKDYGCDIIVCTANNAGVTTDAVEYTEDDGFHIIWTSTYQTFDSQLEQKMHKMKAVHLIDMINQMEAAVL
jgi:uncharacterized protein YuzE